MHFLSQFYPHNTPLRWIELRNKDLSKVIQWLRLTPPKTIIIFLNQSVVQYKTKNQQYKGCWRDCLTPTVSVWPIQSYGIDILQVSSFKMGHGNTPFSGAVAAFWNKVLPEVQIVLHVEV